MTQTPELILEEEEAKAVAESTLTLAAMYDITPDPKLQAMLNLAIILGTTYGTRYIAIRARKAQEKEEKKPGVAGVYGPDGEAQGTTEWRTEGAEWPVNPTNPTIM